MPPCPPAPFREDGLVTRHLGLDLGGSALKGVVLERDGGEPREATRAVEETRAGAAPDEIVAQLAAFGRRLADTAGGVDTAGITVPGLFDAAAGTGEFVTNLGGAAWRGVPIVAPVAEALGVPTALLNDARAFGFAEARLGAARGCDTAVFFTLGTGVGGAVVVGGRLHLGLGSAGELGHQTVLPDGPVCGCGNRGCLETLVQAAAIAAAAGRETAEAAVEAARSGDERALRALAGAGAWLGIGMANAVVTLHPERIVVGGGVAEAGELVLGPAREELRRRVRLAPVEDVEVVRAELGYDAGAIGAALWGAEQA
jgi:glucokinase